MLLLTLVGGSDLMRAVSRLLDRRLGSGYFIIRAIYT